ncbi:ABC transporter permease [Paenibacillus swuensis]|uniref:ABC transporter permease n=1 Tax=Paenibacillus swuensis TaxID=1178515 RepID=A0A172TJG8_9BACL|nr:carbohydrate ABC transporter permease [Paenibacillus swuensis]ANE47112.1 ABC transporter permease [Paenibacillus swuensis]
MYHKTAGYRLFTLFNTLFLVGLALLCILPLLHILAVSLSGRAAANANLVGFWPIDFNMESYKTTIGNDRFIRALWVAVERTVLGTVLSMTIILLAAYPLSKSSAVLKGRTFISWFFVFTMLFSGGLVPWYITVTKLNLTDTLWALILPGAVNVWNLVLMINFLRGIPKELEEAAFIDGAGDWATLFKVFLPLSMPAIATLSLFTMVTNWNAWFDGLLFMEFENYPLSSYLQTIVVQQDFSKGVMRPEDLENFSQRSIKAAQIFVSALPILLVYPFLQRFFVKGMVLGAVKE